jgi:hypothetical protein
MKDQAQTTDVLFYPIDFGMLGISCPKCNMETSGVFVGMTTLDLVEQEEVIMVENPLDAMVTVGVVAYPCGDIYCSPCLATKVGEILNARETDSLRLHMFMNLISCEEHGVAYPEQS